eukprot:scaffold377049_cov43-Prasinocladus_malaysianus.AAC.1
MPAQFAAMMHPLLRVRSPYTRAAIMPQGCKSLIYIVYPPEVYLRTRAIYLGNLIGSRQMSLYKMSGP